MMQNPYTCEVQLDELGPDDTILDFAYLSEENFVLVVLLTSQGEIEAAVSRSHANPGGGTREDGSSPPEFPVPFSIGLHKSIIVSRSMELLKLREIEKWEETGPFSTSFFYDADTFPTLDKE
ncbi:hypothetical protein ANCDUO_01182 [Ancylostoma duodenale]|uniref:Uncharacterized protein n=1 Tax=Ancylostoma duodenale TaxID=51022 RepID=A0A0C2DEU9_9BILA|nr:hypothetical protein ANCDUO_01182 [Ancylostoma duodenale]